MFKPRWGSDTKQFQIAYETLRGQFPDWIRLYGVLLWGFLFSFCEQELLPYAYIWQPREIQLLSDNFLFSRYLNNFLPHGFVLVIIEGHSKKNWIINLVCWTRGLFLADHLYRNRWSLFVFCFPLPDRIIAQILLLVCPVNLYYSHLEGSRPYPCLRCHCMSVPQVHSSTLGSTYLVLLEARGNVAHLFSYCNTGVC